MGESRSTGRVWSVPGRDFSVELKIREDVPLLILRGEIDVYTFPTLSRAIDEVIAEGEKRLVLDFYDVSFLDSGGISVLIRAHKILNAKSGRLEIERLHAHPYRVLEVTGLLDFLNIRQADHNLAA